MTVADPASLTSASEIDGPLGLADDGVFYLVDETGDFFSVNAQTLTATRVGDTFQTLTDIAVAPDGEVYGVTFTGLYRINPATASATFIGSLGQSGINAFTIDAIGRAFAAGNDGSGLFSVNLSTGQATLIGNAGHSIGAAGDLAFFRGDLYSAMEDERLDRIDPATGATLASNLHGVDGVFGLVTYRGLAYAFAGRTIYDAAYASGSLTNPRSWSSGFMAPINGAAAFDFGQSGLARLGGAGADGLSGAGLDDVLSGVGGADTLNGLGGADILHGGAGGDILSGGDGADVLIGGAGADFLMGGSGGDRFVFATAADSPISGGYDAVADFMSGSDKLDFTGTGSGRVFISRSGDTSYVYFGLSGSSYPGAVQVIGQVQGGDVISASGAVIMYGDAGGDILTGAALADVIVGGAGDDSIRGRGGADVLYGQAGMDHFVYGAASESTLAAYDVIADFQSGEDFMDVSGLAATGSSNFALARFGGSTFVYFGQPGSASFQGVIQAIGEVQGEDMLTGAVTDLVFFGSSAGDDLRGADGDDTILGGDGGDLILGGVGADSLFGGAGADVFRYASVGHSTVGAYDVIQDFQVGTDKVDLRGVADSVFLSSFGGSTFIYFAPVGAGYDGLIVAAGVSLTQADVLVTGESAAELDGKDGALTLPGPEGPEPAVELFSAPDALEVSLIARLFRSTPDQGLAHDWLV